MAWLKLYCSLSVSTPLVRVEDNISFLFSYLDSEFVAFYVDMFSLAPYSHHMLNTGKRGLFSVDKLMRFLYLAVAFWPSKLHLLIEYYKLLRV